VKNLNHVLILDRVDSINLKLEKLAVIILNAEISRDEITNSIKGCYHSYRMTLGMSDYWTMVWF
jgi:hypothetical protein